MYFISSTRSQKSWEMYLRIQPKFQSRKNTYAQIMLWNSSSKESFESFKNRISERLEKEANLTDCVQNDTWYRQKSEGIVYLYTLGWLLHLHTVTKLNFLTKNLCFVTVCLQWFFCFDKSRRVSKQFKLIKGLSLIVLWAQL